MATKGIAVGIQVGYQCCNWKIEMSLIPQCDAASDWSHACVPDDCYQPHFWERLILLVSWSVPTSLLGTASSIWDSKLRLLQVPEHRAG